MRNWALRTSIVAVLLGLTMLGTSGRASASIGACRDDPWVAFTSPDGTRGTLVLSAGIATSADSVQNVAWTVDLPSGSSVDRVTTPGNLPATVTVTANGPSGVATAGATVAARP